MPENNLRFISTCWAQIISERAQTHVCVMKHHAALIWCENNVGCPSCMAQATVPSWRDCKTQATSASKIRAEEIVASTKDAN